MSSRQGKVCVVGGGPAGLAAALALTRAGYKVTVVDCAVPPVDKACGEGLMPDSIAALNALGVSIPAHAGFPFRGIRFADGRSSVCADFRDGVARGVRRPVLHDILLRSAAAHGIEVIWGAKHVRVTDSGVSLEGRFLEAGLVVGADGQNSHVRRQAGLDQGVRENKRYGFRRHYRIAPWSPYMELHWGTTAQIYVTPVAADEICVATISRDPKCRLARALEQFPELQRRLDCAEPASVEMGAMSVSRALRRVQRGNVVLLGDASGSVDAITGEGMCLAFKQAAALVTALENGKLEKYGQLHRALMKRARTMASVMLSLDRNAAFQRRALAALASEPAIFESLLAIHVGAPPFRSLCSRRLAGFGRAFLAA